MTGVIIILIIVGSIGIIVAALWKFVAVIAFVALIGWVIGKTAAGTQSAIERRNAYVTAVIKRADKQHNQIMSGQTKKGTYGIYQPPKGLR